MLGVGNSLVLTGNRILSAGWALAQIVCVCSGSFQYQYANRRGVQKSKTTRVNISKCCSSPLHLARVAGGLLLVLSSLVYAQNTEFATDTQSIIKQLGDSQRDSAATTKGGVISKGNLFNPSSDSETDNPTAPVTVLQEIEGNGTSSRAFGVVQRQSVAQRVNLKILFDTDSASIRQESYSLLRSLGEALRTQELTGQVMTVNGHTDSTGSDDYNLQLSFERARSVRDYLVSREGIDQSQLKVLGFGEGAPLMANDSAASRQKNRRVEIERLN